MRAADAGGHAGLQRHAASDQYAGKCVCGFQIVSGYLHHGSAVRVLLQRGDGHFLRAGRFQNAVHLSGRILDEQHLHGYPVRHRVQDGCGRRGVGNVPVSGRELRARDAVCAAPPEERGDRGKERDFLLSAVLPHCGNRRAEHFAAELHLRGQHRHSGRDQFVRFERDGGLLRLRQAQ